MLINEDDFQRRINNPMNLLNKKGDRKHGALSIFIKPSEVVEEKKFTPAFPLLKEDKVETEAVNKESLENIQEAMAVVERKEREIRTDDILKDADANIRLAAVHSKALDIMHTAMHQLEEKMPEMKADKIPMIVSTLGKVITDIRKEQAERNKNQANENVHFHFYCPEPKKLDQYEVIEVQ